MSGTVLSGTGVPGSAQATNTLEGEPGEAPWGENNGGFELRPRPPRHPGLMSSATRRDSPEREVVATALFSSSHSPQPHRILTPYTSSTDIMLLDDISEAISQAFALDKTPSLELQSFLDNALTQKPQNTAPANVVNNLLDCGSKMKAAQGIPQKFEAVAETHQAMAELAMMFARAAVEEREAKVEALRFQEEAVAKSIAKGTAEAKEAPTEAQAEAKITQEKAVAKAIADAQAEQDEAVPVAASDTVLEAAVLHSTPLATLLEAARPFCVVCRSREADRMPFVCQHVSMCEGRYMRIASQAGHD